MTTTPNPTAESVIAEAMVNAGAPLMHSRVEESVAAALRAHGLLSEGAPTEAMILAALNAYANAGLEIDGYEATEEYPSLEMWGDRFASQMRAALVAAQGAARPVNSFDTTAEREKNGGDSLHVAPVPVIDEDALAEVIEGAGREWRTEWLVMQEREEPVPAPTDEWIAAAVDAWLKDGAKR